MERRLQSFRICLIASLVSGIWVVAEVARGQQPWGPPPLVGASPSETLPPPSVPRATATSAFSLHQLQNLALQHNPTIAQARAIINANQGTADQAGLYPNPVIGYTGEQIGVEGTVGELQGGFISQEFVTGGKLRLSRRKYQQRVRIGQTYALAQRQRVLNGVALRFYDALAAQRIVEVRQRILSNAQDNVQTTHERLNLGQVNHAEMLRAEVEEQQDRLALLAAERQAVRAWRELASTVGTPRMPSSPLVGDRDVHSPPLDWDDSLHRLLATSPELAAARQEVQHDEIMVQRERVQPIPNVRIGASVGQNFETPNTVAGVTIGLPLPIYNRNQGTIFQAESDLRRARAEVKRLELVLTNRLAEIFQQYETAGARVEAYQNDMLPKSRRAHDLLVQAYNARRGTWMDVLAAQRHLLELELQLTLELKTLKQSETLICGLLLGNGLEQAREPLRGGHIDATPNPR
jgi:cobalt-zinc-cadmium efflux system outer membrane protein